MTDDAGKTAQVDIPDRSDGVVYVMPEELGLAIDVALSAGRPLLLRGRPGSGKSSLAPYLAKQRNWRFYSFVVTSQTRARDLLWSFDGVRRLADAQASRHLADPDSYVSPGPLWWSLAPRSAAEQAAGARPRDAGAVHEADGPDVREPLDPANHGRSPDHAVLLIDEIDKADPDVPNGLLAPLAAHEFTVAESGRRVRLEADARRDRHDPFQRNLVIITTNEERELPHAFLRRCVVAELSPPGTPEELVAIARAHLASRLGTVEPEDVQLAKEIADELVDVRAAAERDGLREPSTAEYLDALWACRALGIKVSDPRWRAVRGLTLIKPQRVRG